LEKVTSGTHRFPSNPPLPAVIVVQLIINNLLVVDPLFAIELLDTYKLFNLEWIVTSTIRS
jgi:hypothetical protein